MRENDPDEASDDRTLKAFVEAGFEQLDQDKSAPVDAAAVDRILKAGRAKLKGLTPSS